VDLNRQLRGGALPPPVKEVAAKQKDDGCDYDRSPSASLSDHADKRQNDDQDASKDCDDPKVLHGDLPAMWQSSELRKSFTRVRLSDRSGQAVRGLFYHNAEL